MSFFHWPAFITFFFFFFGGGGGGGIFAGWGCLRSIRAYDFVYVFLASLTLDFTAQNFHSVEHLTCACTWSSEISLLSHTFTMAKFWWYRNIFSWFQTNFKFHNHKSSGVNPYQICCHEVSYFIQIYYIVFGEQIYICFLSIILKRYPVRSILLSTQKQSVMID